MAKIYNGRGVKFNPSGKEAQKKILADLKTPEDWASHLFGFKAFLVRAPRKKRFFLVGSGGPLSIMNAKGKSNYHEFDIDEDSWKTETIVSVSEKTARWLLEHYTNKPKTVIESILKKEFDN